MIRMENQTWILQEIDSDMRSAFASNERCTEGRRFWFERETVREKGENLP